MKSSVCTFLLSLLFLTGSALAQSNSANKVFQAGAAKSTITPKIGSSINGNMQDVTVRHVHDDIHARALVLDDGQTKLGFVVLDLCMVSRETLDKAKQRASEFTGIPVQNMMMSATHTHSAGTACGVFQSDPDPAYVDFIVERTADALIRAHENLAPAVISWGVGKEESEVFNRRWYMKPGTAMPNPFGGQDQVKMNPGVENPNMDKPAGPIDPEVPSIFLKTVDGKPIAVLANYSLHYVGGTGPGEISADYYGAFADRIGDLVLSENTLNDPPFVGIMSNGTSGDINNINWPGKKTEALPHYEKIRSVADKVASASYSAIKNAPQQNSIKLAAKQEEIRLGVRKPTAQDIKRAEGIVAKAAGPTMQSLEEIYARETLLLRDYPDQVDLILQVFKIGDLAITAIPAEVFVEIGLELKAKSPFKPTFNIELANGYNGYLPTAKHHKLGGYETWRARSSYLEETAADKILAVLLRLLNDHKSGK
ncbi:MAG: neutral/alkaline non-lysosomal ceramidase N-terminal domain-containing protein [Sphingobacterium hotanense]